MDERPDIPTDAIELAPGVVVAASAVSCTYVSSSGPGGQNVNRRATKCQLRIALAEIPVTPAQRKRLEAILGSRLTDAGEVLIESDERRSQVQNRRACLDRLRECIVQALPAPKRRIKTRPSRGSVERRLKEKRERSETKRRRRRDPSDD